MVFRAVFLCKNNGIISPDHLILTDFIRQCLKDRNHGFLLVGDIAFYVTAKAGKRKLKIILIGIQFVQPCQHRFRIFRPKDNAVHKFRGQHNFTDLIWIYGIAYIQIPLPDSIQKPFGIVIGDVGSAADT